LTIIISLLFSIIVILVAIFVLDPLAGGARIVTDSAITKANSSLADMFMFIDLDRLVKLSFAVIFVATVILYLVTNSFVIPIIVAIIFSFLPNFFLKVMKKKRLAVVRDGLPDLLLNISSSLRAGSGLNQAVELSASEQGGPIAQEFGLFLSELRLGVDMTDALDNLKERVDIQEMDLLVSAIKISREIGGNLADVLHRLSNTLRRKIDMENKITTLTAQGRMQGLVMVFLPIFIGIVLFFMDSTGPYIMHLFTHWYGWITLTVLIALLSLGYFFIRKIVNIDV